MSLLSQLTLKVKLSGFVLSPTIRPLSSDCPNKLREELLIFTDSSDPEALASNEKSLKTLFLIVSKFAFPLTLIKLSANIEPFK